MRRAVVQGGLTVALAFNLVSVLYGETPAVRFAWLAAAGVCGLCLRASFAADRPACRVEWEVEGSGVVRRVLAGDEVLDRRELSPEDAGELALALSEKAKRAAAARHQEWQRKITPSAN